MSQMEIKKRALLLFLGSFLIYVAFLPPGIHSIDGYSMLQVADSLATRHTFAISSEFSRVGRDGQSFSPWYPLQSVFAAPVIGVAAKAASVTHLPIHYVESFAAPLMPTFYTSVTVALVYLLALSLGSTEIGAWLAALIYGFATIAMVYTRDFYADPLLAMLVALSLLVVFHETTSWVIVLLTALAVLAKPPAIMLGPALTVYLFWKTRRFWVSLLPGVGTALGLFVYSLYNFYRFEHFGTFGHAFRFSPSYIPQSFSGLLFSPGGGLLWFCPCAVLSIVAIWQMKTRRIEAFAIVIFLAFFLFLHCFWLAWAGGWSWGPRLMLAVLPGLIALTGLLENNWRRLLVALACITFLLTVPNLVASYQRYYAETTEQGISEHDFYWQPRNSILLNMWPAALRQIRDARDNDVTQLFSERTDTPAKTIATSRALRIVAVWWWVLPVAHISRVWGILVSLLLTITGIVLLVRAKPLAARAKDSGDILPAPAVIT
jgi:4-amino-4-deoxy-L-arabinose transferase-like glycosyltransferase